MKCNAPYKISDRTVKCGDLSRVFLKKSAGIWPVEKTLAGIGREANG